MANRLLRNIAVSIGAGLASRIGRSPAFRPATRPTPNLYPILDRLENIESRVSRVELAPSPIAMAAPEEMEALGTLVSSQSEDIAALRHDLLNVERRNAEQVEAFGQQIALLEHQVPVHIEASIAAKMQELEQRLRGEFQEIHYRTVDAFAETIEKRVVHRINLLENSLIEQSRAISSLRDKSLKTDDNLQRLLEAVDKLCARAEAQSQNPLFRVEPAVAPEQHAATQPAPVQRPVPAQQPVSASTEPTNRGLHVAPDVHHYHPDFESAREVDVPLNGHHSPAPRRGLKPVGMAILGLALLGFRLIK